MKSVSLKRSVMPARLNGVQASRLSLLWRKLPDVRGFSHSLAKRAEVGKTFRFCQLFPQPPCQPGRANAQSYARHGMAERGKTCRFCQLFPRNAILPTFCNALRSWIAGNRYDVGNALWAWQRWRYVNFWQKCVRVF